MILKNFEISKKLDKNINFFLFYGQNTGLIEETIDQSFKPIFSKNIFYYDEAEIISNTDHFKEKILNKSFFENEKLIIINRTTDKILVVIEPLLIDKDYYARVEGNYFYFSFLMMKIFLLSLTNNEYL